MILLVLVAALCVATAASPAGVAEAAATLSLPSRQVGGLSIDATSTYELVAAEARVHVTVVVELENLEPPRRIGSTIRTSFLDRYSLPVLAEAVDVTVRRVDGPSLTIERGPGNEFVDLISADLDPDVVNGAPQSIVFEYDLPARPPRDRAFTRINDAFVSFGLFAVGDPGTAEVEVVLPDGFDVEFVGGQPTSAADDDSVRYRFGQIVDPDTFFVTVAARNDDALVDREIDVGGSDVVVRGWPDDPQWADFVSTTLGDGVPLFEELIGASFPGEDGLDVVESASPYLYGYSGWFVPAEDLIEIGDVLDSQVVLHEVSHLWFNDELFTGRWISEGFAEAYGNRVREQIGGDVAEPPQPSEDAPGRQPLEEWSNPQLREDGSDEEEQYGYATSFHVIDRLLDEVGPDAMRTVLEAADNRRVSYVGDGPAESMATAPDWHRLLDLLVDDAGSAAAESLFRALVVSADEIGAFDQRTVARDEYAALVQLGAGWSAPLPVRLSMSEWEFDEAAELMAESRRILERRDALRDTLTVVGVDSPGGLEAAYETAESIDEVAMSAADHEGVAALLLAAHEAIGDSGNVLGRIGRLGGGADDQFSEASAAFESGDLETAAAAAERSAAIAEDATRPGGLRILAALLVLAMSAALALRVARRGGIQGESTQDLHDFAR